MRLRLTSYAIRERTGGDFHLRTVYKDSLIEVVDLLLQFNGVVAVSYTHLDVYKRQGLSYLLKIKLATDFGKLSDVRVIARNGQQEQKELENKTTKQ